MVDSLIFQPVDFQNVLQISNDEVNKLNILDCYSKSILDSNFLTFSD